MLVTSINYYHDKGCAFYTENNREQFKISRGRTTLDFILERLLAAEKDKGERLERERLEIGRTIRG